MTSVFPSASLLKRIRKNVNYSALKPKPMKRNILITDKESQEVTNTSKDKRECLKRGIEARFFKKGETTMQNILVQKKINKRLFQASRYKKQIIHRRESTGSPQTSAQQYLVLEAHGAVATNVTPKILYCAKVLTFKANDWHWPTWEIS